MKTIYTALTLSDSEKRIDRPQFASRTQIELIWTKEDDNEKKKWLHLVRRKANGFEIYWTIFHSFDFFICFFAFQTVFFFLTYALFFVYSSCRFSQMLQNVPQEWTEIFSVSYMPRTNVSIIWVWNWNDFKWTNSWTCWTEFFSADFHRKVIITTTLLDDGSYTDHNICVFPYLLQ